MKDFSGILLCTDMDGTLLKKDHSVSPENIKAIEFFKNQGGLFIFVTGRAPILVSDYYNIVKPNAPIGCINGAGLYDFNLKNYIFKKTMHDSVFELIEFVSNNFLNVGIRIVTFDDVYFYDANKNLDKFKYTLYNSVINNLSEVKGSVAKITFSFEKEDVFLNLKNSLEKHSLSKNFSFVRSERTLYEIAPKNINKGSAIQKLTELLNIDINKTIAIGDYDNDIPMFKIAKIGIAVSNASENAQKNCNFITVSNEENAIAQVIYDLKDGKFAL